LAWTLSSEKLDLARLDATPASTLRGFAKTGSGFGGGGFSMALASSA